MAFKKYLRFVHHMWSRSDFQWAMRWGNLEQDHWVDNTSFFPDRCRIKWSRASKKCVQFLTFQHRKITGSLSWSFPWGPKGLPEQGSFVALTITNFWNLHGQLQTLTGLVTRFKGCSQCHSCSCSHSGVAFIWVWWYLWEGQQTLIHTVSHVSGSIKETIQKLAEQTGEDKGAQSSGERKKNNYMWLIWGRRCRASTCAVVCLITL